MSSVGPEGEAQWRALERKREIREVVLELLDSPLDLPDRFRGWVPRLVESSGIQVPISQVVGNFLVEDTTDKLGGTIHGRNGMIRGGSSPYDFFQLSYDAVYGKWVSSFLLGGQQAGVCLTNSTSYTIFNDMGASVIPYEDFYNAGLIPQVRMSVFLLSDNASGTATARMEFGTYDSGDAVGSAGSGTASSWTLTSTGTTPTFKDSGWQDIPSLTTKKFMIGVAELKTNNAAYAVGFIYCTIWLRWVST